MLKEIFAYLDRFLRLSPDIIKFELQILGTSGQRRHAIRWLQSLQPAYLLDTPLPWITFDAIDFLKQSLKPNSRIFEYGSGGSTLFWLLFNPQVVISIEHDHNWFSVVSSRFENSSFVDYRLIVPEPYEKSQPVLDPADPNSYSSDDFAFARYTFQRYVSQIDVFPDNYFDVVMIDGRARPSCIKHSVRKVKAGGFLILDNADLTYYTAQTQIYLQNFECKKFYGVGPRGQLMWQTNIYVREMSP